MAFVASAGDYGAPASWPAASPNVLAVGGTALTLGTRQRLVERDRLERQRRRPQRLRVAAVVSERRGHPDARRPGPTPTSPTTPSPSTGFAVYDSVPYSGTTLDWVKVGGTSAGAPQWSALLAIADQGRALAARPRSTARARSRS